MPRFLFLFVLILPISPLMAQERMDIAAAALCLSPPMEEGSMDRMRRSAGYVELLDGLALQCPDVAMLFAEWSVGTADRVGLGTLPGHAPDLLFMVGPARLFGQTASSPPN